nr:Fic family protein [Clostridium thermobutyricum]
MNYDYDKFLETLKETKGLHNSLNEILKYDFIYHSDKMEGSNFNIETLKMLIEKDIVIGGHYLDDVHETINSFYVFDLVIDSLGKPLNLEMIKEWHKHIMYRTRLYDIGLAGSFKKYKNKIIGEDVDILNPCEVADRLNRIIKNYKTIKKVTLKDILEFHLDFEKIHPFQECNGKIGRFIYLKQLLENKLPLKYMNSETSKEYKAALSQAKDNNIEPLLEYIHNQKDFIQEHKNIF